MRRIDKVEVSLDPLDTQLQTIDSALNAGQIFFQSRHARLQIVNDRGQAIDLFIDAPEVDQDKAVRFRRHPAYSAAISTGSGCGLAAYWSMRRSISGRMCRMRPWIGQAAASPSAQMVWPSIWVVTSRSMSISRRCARPSAMREITRHIHPVPSRHGVHWPQDSCL